MRDRVWWVAYTNITIINAGPPNQYFFPPKKGGAKRGPGWMGAPVPTSRSNPMQMYASVFDRTNQSDGEGDESGAEDRINIEKQETPRPPIAPSRGEDPR